MLSADEKTQLRAVYAEYELLLPWETKKLEIASKNLVSDKKWKLRDTLMTIRRAVTGEKIGLPLFETLVILGKKAVLLRMRQTL